MVYLSAKSYYDALDQNNCNSAEDLTGALLSAFAGGTDYSGMAMGELPDNMRIVSSALGGSDFASAYSHLMDQSYDSTQASAYLNYMVFDENFNLVPGQSAALQATGSANQWNNVGTASEVEVGRPGYLLVFTSSRQSAPFFFDKVDLSFYKGAVLEENHYYPFGLTLNTVPVTNPLEGNKYLLTTKELQDEHGLNWYNFGARMMDEQIGRWTSVDPLCEKLSNFNPYNYVRDNPIIRIDRDGKSDYKLSSDGTLVLFDKRDGDKFDRIVATGNSKNIKYNKDGTPNSSYMQLDKGVINVNAKTAKDENGNAVDGYSMQFNSRTDDAKNVFEFLVASTSVEYSLLKYKDNGHDGSYIFTSKEADAEYFDSEYIGARLLRNKDITNIENSHNHPVEVDGRTLTPAERSSPSDYDGDQGAARTILKYKPDSKLFIYYEGQYIRYDDK